MALKVNRLSRNILKVLGILALVALCIALGLVSYREYKAKNQGQHIMPSGTLGQGEVVDETEITEEQVEEHVVAANKPRYLSVPKLGIKKARILEVGILSNSQLDSPINIFDVGWYRNSSKPGAGGAILMDGHNGGPTKEGVFKHLNSLIIGDEIIIERGDGRVFTYVVSEVKNLSLQDANDYMPKMLETFDSDKEGLNLITCTGNWIQSQSTYDQRTMLRATSKD